MDWLQFAGVRNVRQNVLSDLGECLNKKRHLGKRRVRRFVANVGFPVPIASLAARGRQPDAKPPIFCLRPRHSVVLHGRAGNDSARTIRLAPS